MWQFSYPQDFNIERRTVRIVPRQAQSKSRLECYWKYVELQDDSHSQTLLTSHWIWLSKSVWRNRGSPQIQMNPRWLKAEIPVMPPRGGIRRVLYCNNTKCGNNIWSPCDSSIVYKSFRGQTHPHMQRHTHAVTVEIRASFASQIVIVLQVLPGDKRHYELHPGCYKGSWYSAISSWLCETNNEDSFS